MILALALTAVLESNAIEEAVVAAREHGKAIAGGGNEHVALPDPVRVYVLYWTAFVGDDGEVQFRRDVYERDAELAAALRR